MRDGSPDRHRGCSVAHEDPRQAASTGPDMLLLTGPFVSVSQFLAHSPNVELEPMFALVNTGASITCVRQEHASKLPLLHHGTQRVSMPGHPGSLRLPLYYVGLRLLDQERREQKVFPCMSVVAMPNLDPQFDVILGRDLLSRMRLEYDGPGRMFTMVMDEG